MDEEYKVLREELRMSFSNIVTYTTVMYTASNVILVFALGKDEFYFCLVPLLVILPLYLLCENQHRQICRLGAYLYVFCEGEHFNWEHRLHYFDLVENPKREIASTLPTITLVAACCISSIIKIWVSKTFGNIYLLVPAIALAISMYIVFSKRVQYPSTRSKYIREWEEVKKKMK